MEKHYEITKIDFNELRNQKRELLKVIRERNLPDGEDDLDGILHLIDSIQDFVCDELGYPEMEVFDFQDEDPEFNMQPETLWDKNATTDVHTKQQCLCSQCGSDNIDVHELVNPNTNKVKRSEYRNELGLCNDCGQPCTICFSTLKADAQVIGFQVLSDDDDSEIHPDMVTGKHIYSLSIANDMIKRGCRNPEQQWRLLAIWDGDIENPVFTFTGDPRA